MRAPPRSSVARSRPWRSAVVLASCVRRCRCRRCSVTQVPDVTEHLRQRHRRTHDASTTALLHGLDLATEERGGARIVRATVPLSEMFGYVGDLRSKTQG